MMRVSWGVVVGCCVWWHLLVGVAAANDGVLSSTILTGSFFSIPDFNRTSNDAQGHRILLVTNQTNGVPLNGPELQVIANTTIYFNLTAIEGPSSEDSVSVGLTRTTSVAPALDAEPLGLTPTPDSLAALSCTSHTDNTQSIGFNSWGLNFTFTTFPNRIFSTTPCVVQWLVPPYDPAPNATKYYYYNPSVPSTPRRIYIVAAPASPTGSAGNGTGTTTAPPTTAPPTTRAPPTRAPTPTGPGSSSPTPNDTSSSTGSNPPSAAFASAHVSGWAALVAALATISAVAAL